MKLKCPLCFKSIEDCECGNGCAYKGPACRDEPALYAIPVCPDCVELPKREEDMAVLFAANAWVAAVEAGRGGDIGKLLPNGYLWPLILAVREWRKAQ